MENPIRPRSNILNEVLSLNAQECAHAQLFRGRYEFLLNEVLSLNAQEFLAQVCERGRAGPQ